MFFLVKSKKMNTILKKGLAIGAGAYFTAYALLSGYAFIDMKRNREEIRQNAPDQLIIRKYKTKIDREEKTFALVGENHYSTSKEAEHIHKIIREYKNIGIEGSDKQPKDMLFSKIVNNFPSPAPYFYLNGSGRLAFDSDVLSTLCSKTKFCLEDVHPYDNFDTLDKAYVLGKTLLHALTAPALYYIGKGERNIPKEKHEKKFMARKKITKRDKMLLKNIFSALRKNDKAAFFVGLKHIGLIDAALHDNLKLEERMEEK